jgi:hypothetical protein
MTAMLGMPQVPQTAPDPTANGPVIFAETSHHFHAVEGTDVNALAAAAPAPLSVILQVTKRCNFDCVH